MEAIKKVGLLVICCIVLGACGKDSATCVRSMGPQPLYYISNKSSHQIQVWYNQMWFTLAPGKKVQIPYQDVDWSASDSALVIYDDSVYSWHRRWCTAVDSFVDGNQNYYDIYMTPAMHNFLYRYRSWGWEVVDDGCYAEVAFEFTDKDYIHVIYDREGVLAVSIPEDERRMK